MYPYIYVNSVYAFERDKRIQTNSKRPVRKISIFRYSLVYLLIYNILTLSDINNLLLIPDLLVRPMMTCL